MQYFSHLQFFMGPFLGPLRRMTSPWDGNLARFQGVVIRFSRKGVSPAFGGRAM
jgi:hypothetical protein